MGTVDRRKNSLSAGQFGDAYAPKSDARARCGCEPSLDELLAEPLIKLAMAADRVDAAVMYALFREVRQKLDGFCRI
jgi:hypothetical protein